MTSKRFRATDLGDRKTANPVRRPGPTVGAGCQTALFLHPPQHPKPRPAAGAYLAAGWSEISQFTELSAGDGHAAQGDGEVDQTAIETSLRGRIQLTVRKNMGLAWPRAETASDFISMAADPDLMTATKAAIQEMIDFLAVTKGLTKHQAYQIVSIAGNVAVTQLVDKPNLGVHVKVPKSIFK